MLTISAFLDESGKTTSDVAAVGGVISPSQHFNTQFVPDWDRCLYMNGINTLTMKEALRADRPLSDRNPALGIENRIAALLPFIECVRRHLMVISGLAINAKAFGELPSHYHQVMGKDPSFTSFARTLLAILEITEVQDKISLICDDEEQTAWPMYQLFRRVKLLYPDAHEKLKAITFADDRWSFGLQAADMVVSLVRQEAEKRFYGAEFNYSSLYSALVNPKPQNGDSFWLIQIGFVDGPVLNALAEKWTELKPHSLQEVNATFEGVPNEGKRIPGIPKR